LLKPSSFNAWRKVSTLIIVILNYSEVDIEVSEIGVETTKFSDCREMSGIDKVANSVLTIIHNRP